MQHLEFDFMRGFRREFLDLEISNNFRIVRTVTKVQLMKREIRKLDEFSRAALLGWFLEYEATAWEREVRRAAGIDRTEVR